MSRGPKERIALIASHCAAMSNPITCHVLDTSTGRPGAGIDLRLEYMGSTFSEGGQWTVLRTATTNDDGRAPTLTASPKSDEFKAGVYRMVFQTGQYFQKHGTETFYPIAHIIFEIKDPSQHYHIPLLLSPYGYTTYRGS